MLVAAATNGYLPIVKLLYENGVNLHFNNDLAFIEACRHKKRDIVEFLSSKGFNFSALDSNKQISPCSCIIDNENKCLQSIFLPYEGTLDPHSSKLSRMHAVYDQLGVYKTEQSNTSLTPGSSLFENNSENTATTTTTTQATTSTPDIPVTRNRSGSWTYQSPAKPLSKLDFPRKDVEIILYCDSAEFEVKLYKYLHCLDICQKLSKALNVNYLFERNRRSSIPRIYTVHSNWELQKVVTQDRTCANKADETITPEFVIFAAGGTATSNVLNYLHDLELKKKVNSVILFDSYSSTTPNYSVISNRIYNFLTDAYWAKDNKSLAHTDRLQQPYNKWVNIIIESIDLMGQMTRCTFEEIKFEDLKDKRFRKIIESIDMSNQYHAQTKLTSIIQNKTSKQRKNDSTKPLIKATSKQLPIVLICNKLTNNDSTDNTLGLLAKLEAEWSDYIKQQLAFYDKRAGEEFDIIRENPYSRVKLGDEAVDQVQTEIKTYRLEQEYLAKRNEQIVLPALERLCCEQTGSQLHLKRPINVAIVASGGGSRAMFATYGALKGLQEIGVLPTVSYICGLSGSTWAINKLYTEINKNKPEDITGNAGLDHREALIRNSLNSAIKLSLACTPEFDFIQVAVMDRLARWAYKDRGRNLFG